MGAGCESELLKSPFSTNLRVKQGQNHSSVGAQNGRVSTWLLFGLHLTQNGRQSSLAAGHSRDEARELTCNAESDGRFCVLTS